MKTPQEIKSFVSHCKDVASCLDTKKGKFHHVEILIDGGVFVEYNTWTEDYYAIEITPFLNAKNETIIQLKQDRERLEQEEIAKHEARQVRLREELERKEYERLKAKFE